MCGSRGGGQPGSAGGSLTAAGGPRRVLPRVPQRLSGSLGERAPAGAVTGQRRGSDGAAPRAGVTNVHLGADSKELSLLGTGEVCFHGGEIKSVLGDRR